MSQQAYDELMNIREVMFKESMAKLPPEKRAAEFPEEMCLARSPEGMQCTRKKGHESGTHVAHGSLGQIAEEWE